MTRTTARLIHVEEPTNCRHACDCHHPACYVSTPAPARARHATTCWCGATIEQAATGRTRKFCSDRCRVEAWRQKVWDAYQAELDAYQQAELATQVEVAAEYRAWQKSPDRPGPAWAEEAIAAGWTPPRGYPGKIAPEPRQRTSGVPRPKEPTVPRPSLQAKPVIRGQWW